MASAGLGKRLAHRFKVAIFPPGFWAFSGKDGRRQERGSPANGGGFGRCLPVGYRGSVWMCRAGKPNFLSPFKLACPAGRRFYSSPSSPASCPDLHTFNLDWPGLTDRGTDLAQVVSGEESTWEIRRAWLVGGFVRSHVSPAGCPGWCVLVWFWWMASTFDI
jgi:hypothetical protein